MFPSLFQKNFFNKLFFICICLIISSQIFFKLLLTNDFNHFLIYDDISFENVIFYITKSYSLINNYSFFFNEDINTPNFLISNAIISNIFYSIFLFLFGEITDLVIVFTLTITLFCVLFIFLKKFLNLPYFESLFLIVVLIIFFGVGPESIKTIFNFLSFNEIRTNLLFRYFSPLITSLFFIIYLYILNFSNEKKYGLLLHILSFINVFSYFYSFMIVSFLNFLLSIKKFKENKKFFFSINIISLIGFIFYIFLYKQFMDFAHTAEFKVFNFNKNYLEILIQLRDVLVSILILILGYILIKKTEIQILNKILILKIIIYFFYIIEIFLIDLQISMHLSMYYLRPLNWILILFIFYNIFPYKKFLRYTLSLLTIYLVITVSVQNFYFYNKQAEVENKNLNLQKQIVLDLKKIDSFLNNSSSSNEIYINESYTNSIFSSLVDLNGEKKIYIKNNGIFRSNNLSKENAVIRFVKFCKFIEISNQNCFNEFVNYETNNYFNNSFIFTGNREFEKKVFFEIFRKKFKDLNYDFKNTQFLIYNNSDQYEYFNLKFSEKGFKKLLLDQLTLYY